MSLYPNIMKTLDQSNMAFSHSLLFCFTFWFWDWPDKNQPHTKGRVWPMCLKTTKTNLMLHSLIRWLCLSVLLESVYPELISFCQHTGHWGWVHSTLLLFPLNAGSLVLYYFPRLNLCVSTSGYTLKTLSSKHTHKCD